MASEPSGRPFDAGNSLIRKRVASAPGCAKQVCYGMFYRGCAQGAPLSRIPISRPADAEPDKRPHATYRLRRRTFPSRRWRSARNAFSSTTDARAFFLTAELVEIRPSRSKYVTAAPMETRGNGAKTSILHSGGPLVVLGPFPAGPNTLYVSVWTIP
jgi:hypothetical protein